MTTAAIVLAAGRGARFAGRRATAHKLLTPLGGEPLIRHSVRAALAAPVDEVIVVTGDPSVAIAEALRGLDVRIVENAEYAEGMAASLRRGVAVVRRWAHAAVIALGDQPTVPTEAYRRVIETWRREHQPIVVPSYRGAHGHPVLFSAAVFDELTALSGDDGARSVVAADRGRVSFVEVPCALPRDVDTEQDLRALMADQTRA